MNDLSQLHPAPPTKMSAPWGWELGLRSLLPGPQYPPQHLHSEVLREDITQQMFLVLNKYLLANCHELWVPHSTILFSLLSKLYVY